MRCAINFVIPLARCGNEHCLLEFLGSTVGEGTRLSHFVLGNSGNNIIIIIIANCDPRRSTENRSAAGNLDLDQRYP